MPIYVRSYQTDQGYKNANVTGPYEEAKLGQIRQHVQNLSSRGTNTVEAFWVCGRRRPMLLFIYQSGEQKYPRNNQEERQLQNVTSCLARPGASSRSAERSPRSISPNLFSKARKLPGRFACPAKIVSAKHADPLQDLQLPAPVQTYSHEKQFSDQSFPPISPSLGQNLSYPGMWPNFPPIPSNFRGNE